MLKALIRTGFLAGAAYVAYNAAKKYWGSDFDQVIDKAKSTAKDIGNDFLNKDEAVNSSMRNLGRKTS